MKQLYIYVSGPYSAPEELDGKAKRSRIKDNIEAADSYARQLARKGHFPFVPHTMMRGWEDAKGFPREPAMQICHQWVKKCDALFYIGSSPGAESERQQAVRHGLRIYRSVDDVPDASQPSSSQFSSEAREALLTEYRECMESYRHTYTTIWQAGGIFTAISAALVALAANMAPIDPTVDMRNLLTLLAPLPFLFWWWGIFLPMDRYGERRNDRLVEIEEELTGAINDLEMWHFRRYSQSRKATTPWKRVFRLMWIWNPRVKEVVILFGVMVALAQIYLVYDYFLG